MVTQIEVVRAINDCKTWKEEVNKQNKELKAFATQTHVVHMGEGDLMYVAVLFYNVQGELKNEQKN